MIRTRVGYAGGTTADPTYRRIGDHTETIEIDFDPRTLSYADLLTVFFASHNACSRPWSRQYMSAIFTHGDEQLDLARAAAAAEGTRRDQPTQTLIEPAGTFYLAEDYHQKYRLRADQEIADELQAIYPELRGFVDSTVATRLNGYLAGYGDRALFDAELPKFGLSDRAQRRIAARVGQLRSAPGRTP